MLDDSTLHSDTARTFQLDSMSLAIIETQRNALEALALHPRKNNCGIHSPRDKNNCSFRHKFEGYRRNGANAQLIDRRQN
jgi:hypothetical protein